MSSASAAQELRVCGEDVDYSPHVNGQGQGLLKDLVEFAAKASELKVSYVYRPWKRCLAMVQQGELDAMMAVSWTEDRAKLLKYPEDENGLPRANQRIWMSKFVIFVHKNSTLAWDGEVFQGLKAGVGTPLGYVTELPLRQAGALSPNSVSLEQGLVLVNLHRLDGYVVERQIGWQMASKLGIESELKTLPTPLLEVPWFVAFSPTFFQGNQLHVERFWRFLASAREEHREALEQHYGLR